jgi:hypothetical protein
MSDARDAEVKHLGAGWCQHHVAGFEIAVDNAGAMGAVDCSSYLDGPRERFVDRQRPTFQPRRKRLAVKQLQNEVVNSRLETDVVDCANVGGIERGDRACFTLEALTTVRIADPDAARNLESHVSSEARIAGPEQLAHPAGIDWTDYLVRPELAARHQRSSDRRRIARNHGRIRSAASDRGNRGHGQAFKGRTLREVAGGLMRRQQRLDFCPQRSIVGARRVKIGNLCEAIPLERLMKQRCHPPPAACVTHSAPL